MAAIGPSASLWCAHPRIRATESFSSWLHRVAFANGMADHTFCRHLFGPRPVWNRDVDHLVDENMLTLAASAFLESRASLASGTLRSLEGIFFENVCRGGHFSWVLPLGVYHRTRRRHGQQFCAACLREGDPWLRFPWRFAWVVCCPHHQTVLRDACPNCDAPIAFHRMSLATPGRLVCDRCNGNILKNSPDAPASKRIVRFQAQMLKIMKNGEAYIGKECLTAFDYFRGLRDLVRGAYPNGRLAGLQNALFPQDPVAPRSKLAIERWRHPARALAIEILARALERWPDGFIDMCLRAKVYRARFEPQGRELHPAWVESALRSISR